jgi:hypothetical protein
MHKKGERQQILWYLSGCDRDLQRNRSVGYIEEIFIEIGSHDYEDQKAFLSPYAIWHLVSQERWWHSSVLVEDLRTECSISIPLSMKHVFKSYNNLKVEHSYYSRFIDEKTKTH